VVVAADERSGTPDHVRGDGDGIIWIAKRLFRHHDPKIDRSSQRRRTSAST
jgi:hypothetical protein